MCFESSVIQCVGLKVVTCSEVARFPYTIDHDWTTYNSTLTLIWCFLSYFFPSESVSFWRHWIPYNPSVNWTPLHYKASNYQEVWGGALKPCRQGKTLSYFHLHMRLSCAYVNGKSHSGSGDVITAWWSCQTVMQGFITWKLINTPRCP